MGLKPHYQKYINSIKFKNYYQTSLLFHFLLYGVVEYRLSNFPFLLFSVERRGRFFVLIKKDGLSDLDHPLQPFLSYLPFLFLKVADVMFCASSMITNFLEMVTPLRWAISITSILCFIIKDSVAVSCFIELMFPVYST